MESKKETVLITGITGYIGSWVCKRLLDTYGQQYKIRATVRDSSNLAKLEPLKKAFGEENFNLIEFVGVDLSKPDQIAKAIVGVQYILHLASPSPGAKKMTADEMILPTKIGMNAIIDASVKNQVKKIVVTSSIITVLGALWKKSTGNNHYLESDFAPAEDADPFGKSKIAQESICREFLKEQEKSRREPQLEIVILLPTFVVGPTLIPERNSSPELVGKIMRRDMPGLPNLIMPAVDVRDVADAHLQAMIRPGLNGQRIILAKEPMPLLNTAMWLDEELGPQGFRVQTRRLGYCPIKFASFFDQQARILIPLINVDITVDNSSSRNLLGIKYERKLRDSVVEMGYSLIDFGIVPDVRKQKKAGSIFCHKQ